MSSQLPEWMRNPEEPERTTVSWEIGQAWRRTRIWRAMSAFGEWWRTRYRITQRFPRTTATIAFFLSLAVAVAIYFLILLLLAHVY
ncbi:MAG TPA: hypothetical protein VFC19_18600 [Candidatus Limnocylindrales bacterium]|nr:hypothetical protein [Candidatus Limnocylindrales bacterium]